jgi:hypothetical protein
MPEEDLVLTKTLSARIKYVRENLVDEAGESMTQPAFAKAVGLADGHHGVMGWEKHDREPRGSVRTKIAALTKGAYRPLVFSRLGAEEVVVASAVPRLQSLEDDAAWSRSTLEVVLKSLAEAGIQVLLPEAAPRSAATAAPASRRRKPA